MRTAVDWVNSYCQAGMCAVSVVQRLRHQVVDLEGEGSNPFAHPTFSAALRLVHPRQSPTGSPVRSASRHREYTGWQVMRLIWGNSDPMTDMFAKTELMNALASDDAGDRTEAMRRLQITGEDELIPFLADCLTHYYEELRRTSTRVLTRLGDDSVLLGFVEALQDPAFRVRYDAAKAILAFDDSRPLVRHIQHHLGLPWDTGLATRIEAIEALGRLGDARAVPCLAGALREGDDSVRTAAIDALGRLGGQRAEKALIPLLNRGRSERVLTAARRALERIRGEESPEGLTQQRRASGNEDGIVTVRLKDLCRVADAMATMVHDLDNGKTKYLHIELDEIHDVVERWVADEDVLGGGCHTHRCRLCEEFGVIW